MAPPQEITAQREMMDVSQVMECQFDGTVGLFVNSTTPNKRATSTLDESSSDEDEESLVPRTVQKKHRSSIGTHSSRTSSSMASVSNKSRVDVPVDVPAIAPDVHPPSCVEHWLEHSNQAAFLLVMCIGLKGSSDEHFAVTTDDPNYKTRNNRSKFKATKIMLINEVKRRHKLYHGSDKDKKCASFTVPQLLSYLVANPIVNEEDVQFLLAEESKFRAGLDAADKERADLSELHSGEDAWIGDLPWLRLYHVMIADCVKEAYKRVNDWENRDGIDARNSDIRPKSFYEVASDLYNNQSFRPKSFLYPNLHEEYNTKHNLSLRPNIPEASPDKIKKKLAEARAKLMSMIADWEKSGNGCGQRGEGSASFGHIGEDQLWLNVDAGAHDEEEFMDGDNRSSFLGNRRVHLLYMWELFDEYSLLDQTMNKLSNACSATADHVPTTAEPMKKADDKKVTLAKQHADLLLVQERTAQSIRMIADSQACSQIVALENTLIKLQDRLMSQVVQSNDQYKQDFEDQVSRIKRQLDELYAKSSGE